MKMFRDCFVARRTHKIFLCILGMSTLFLYPSPARAQGFPGTSLLVSTIQDPQVLSSAHEMEKLVAFAKNAGLDTLFIQVYRANRSWFPSAYADATPYQKCSQGVAQDPFALLIAQSHAQGLKVFAWFNVLSLSENKDAPILKRYGPEVLTRNAEKKKELSDYKIDNQFFLEPGDRRVRHDLLGIVEEMVRRYPDLDGILFDYIRYPDVKPAYGYTTANMARFKNTTGSSDIREKNELWRKWKRDQVTELLGTLIKKARSISPKISVAAAGCVSYVRAYDEAFQDWPSWVNNGLVDFVVLMNYPIDLKEFERNSAEAKGKVNDFKKVKIAVGAYKLLKMPEMFAQQLLSAKNTDGGGRVVFHYGSLCDEPLLETVLVSDMDPKTQMPHARSDHP